MEEANNNHEQAANPKEFNSTPEAKLPFGKNTTFKHSALGEIEIKYISVGDSQKIAQFLMEADDHRFARLVIHNQMIHHELSFDAIEVWQDEDLITACSYLLENEPAVKKHFRRNSEHSFFEDFREAFVENRKEYVQNIKIITIPMMKQMQLEFGDALKGLASVMDFPGLKVAIQALSSYNFGGMTETMQLIQNMSRFVPPQVVLPAIRPVWLDIPLIEPSKYRMPHMVGEVSNNTIEILLNDLAPELEQKRQGAWQTFHGESPDRLSQAMHSMREVLRQLLDKLAPEDEIPKAPWYSKPSKGSSPVTRKMRVRYALVGNMPDVSQSTLELIDSFADCVEKTYGKLSSEAHRQDEPVVKQVEGYLSLSEAVILNLLVNRNIDTKNENEQDLVIPSGMEMLDSAKTGPNISELNISNRLLSTPKIDSNKEIVEIIQEIKALNVGDKRIDAISLLNKFREKWAEGIWIYDVPVSDRASFAELSIRGVLQLQQRRTASGARQYDTGYWILTDFGNQIMHYVGTDKSNINK
jgi:hypothetical protein